MTEDSTVAPARANPNTRSRMSGAVITPDSDWRETMLSSQDQAHSVPLAFECSWAIESACVEILDRAAAGTETSEEAHALRYFRMTAMRIKQLNSVLMSFLGGDDITAGEAYREVYGRFAQQEVTR